MENQIYGGMSATIKAAKKELADTHEPRIMVVETGSTFAEIAQRLGGYKA